MRNKNELKSSNSIHDKRVHASCFHKTIQFTAYSLVGAELMYILKQTHVVTNISNNNKIIEY